MVKEKMLPSQVSAEPRRKNVESRGVRLRDAISKHFLDVNRGSEMRYLGWLSREQPVAYCGLVAKTIPQQVAIQVQHHAIDLGATMVAAAKQLEAIRAATRDLVTIDVTPDTLTGPPVPLPTMQLGDLGLDVARDSSDVASGTGKRVPAPKK